MVVLVRNTPEEMGLRPDGDAIEPGASSKPNPLANAGAGLAEAVRTPFFWSISLGSACMLS